MANDVVNKPVGYVAITKKKITQAKLNKFLVVLRQTGKVGVAAKAAGYASSAYIREVYHKDAAFAKAWDDALQIAHDDILEPEAIRRAVEGFEKDVYFKGEVVGTELVHSDQLLMFLMRGANPNKYRENVNINGHISHTHKIGIAVLPLTAPSMEAWEVAAVEVHNKQKLLNPPSEPEIIPPSKHNVADVVR